MLLCPWGLYAFPFRFLLSSLGPFSLHYFLCSPRTSLFCLTSAQLPPVLPGSFPLALHLLPPLRRPLRAPSAFWTKISQSESSQPSFCLLHRDLATLARSQHHLVVVAEISLLRDLGAMFVVAGEIAECDLAAISRREEMRSRHSIPRHCGGSAHKAASLEALSTA